MEKFHCKLGEIGECFVGSEGMDAPGCFLVFIQQ